MRITKEAKCVVDLSQSVNNIEGVVESKRIHGIIVYICPYLFLYILILLFSKIFMYQLYLVWSLLGFQL